MSRPVFTLSRAAQLTGVSRSTMRRYQEAGDFPNAYQTPKKVWMIPVEDLLARGLKLQNEASATVTLSDHAQSSTQPSPRATPREDVDALKDELARVREELAGERARREGVESLVEEVRRRADLAEMALRQIEAPKPRPRPTVPVESYNPGKPDPATVPRNWWQKLWAHE